MDFATCGDRRVLFVERNVNEVAVNSLLALGRLYQLQTYSMPRFVLGACPFVGPGDKPLLDVLRQVMVQQEHMASQLAEAILLRGGSLPKETYPTRYASLHDLELRYLLIRILEEQRVVVSFIDELAHSVREDKPAQRLAQQVRRNETAHLRLFEELCLRYPTTGHRQRGDHTPDAVRQLDSRRSKTLPVSTASANEGRDAQAEPWGLAS
jgi:hypothetical protein